jgi:hypothetical protein
MRRLVVAAMVGSFFVSTVGAGAADRSAGATLDRPSSARAAALGDALSARDNDIAAFDFNPSALSSLRETQASIFFERAAEQGGFGKIVLGVPSARGGVGVSVGYFSSGSIDVYDDDRVTSAEGQRDMTFALGASRRFANTHLGIAGKYLQSTLLETESAHAAAVDVGVQQELGARLRAGFSLLNFGSKLKFGDTGDPLARQARLGLRTTSKALVFPLGIQVESSYFLVEQKIQFGAGLEMNVGPLALRAGFKSFDHENDIGVGTGFAVGNIGLDYAFSVGVNSEAKHQLSLVMKFSGASPAMKKGGSLSRSSAPVIAQMAPARASTVYEVKAGDTWETVAAQFLGDAKLAPMVKDANKFAGIVDIPPPGRKILVP